MKRLTYDIIFIVAFFVPTFFFQGCVKDPVTKDVTPLYPEGVVMLDSANFTSKLTVPGLIAMVDFFSPMCDSCKKFDDTIKVIAQLYKDKALIGKVNCLQNDTLRNAFLSCIDEYPNLIFFSSGKAVKCKHGVMPVEKAANILDSLLASVAPQ